MVESLYDGGIMPLTCIPEPSGDFDEDSDVDGADFLYWQLNDGSESNLTVWQEQFGNSSSFVATANIPEPSTLLLGAMLGLSAVSIRRPRSRACSTA
jgi:hypothetical protein